MSDHTTRVIRYIFRGNEIGIFSAALQRLFIHNISIAGF